jgi:filamentous hemagglutinin
MLFVLNIVASGFDVAGGLIGEGLVVSRAAALRAIEADVGETAGRALNTNLGKFGSAGRSENCINCAIAGDATLSGRPATALPSRGPVPISAVEKAYGRKWSKDVGIGEVETSLAAEGPGAKAIVFGNRGPGKVGHVFNAVVNNKGAVKFLDTQIGKPATTTGFKSFKFLRTN